MRFIVTADDFGFSDDTVEATIAGLEAGVLTSTSIMANMPASERAIAYAKAHPEFSYGVHLTFAGDGVERPLSPPQSVSALVDAEGRFAAARDIRLRALRRAIPPAQIDAELRAQIAWVVDHGVRIAYVDSHKHIHKYGHFQAALRRALPGFGITRVRNVQDIYLRRPWRSPTVWLGPFWRRRLMAAFDTTDHFYMPSSTGDSGWAAALLARLPTGLIEVGGHPGKAEDWRVQEAVDLQAFAAAARAGGHELIGWADA